MKAAILVLLLSLTAGLLVFVFGTDAGRQRREENARYAVQRAIDLERGTIDYCRQRCVGLGASGFNYRTTYPTACECTWGLK